MAVSVTYKTQLQELNHGLRNLKRSHMLVQPEVKTMCTAIERHNSSVKLGQLTGQSKEQRDQGVQDTKFYYILTRVLVEILNGSDAAQRAHLLKVYQWYQTNKHIVAHSGPKFGRQKRTKTAARQHSVDNLDSSFRRLLGELSGANAPPKKSAEQEFIDLDITDLTREHMPYLYADHIDTDNFDHHEDHAPVDIKRPHSVAASERGPLQEKRPKSDPLDPLLPRRQPLPLSHLYNPHSKDDPAPSPGGHTEVNAPVKFKVTGRGDGRTTVSDTDRLAYRRKWDAFVQEHNHGQEILSKLQHVGRSGLPGGVRYSAHERTGATEESTERVIRGYMAEHAGTRRLTWWISDKINPSPDPPARPPPRLLESRLEEFYELAEGFYPPRQPSYGALRSPRVKSAPAQGRDREPGTQGRPRTAGKPRVHSAKHSPEADVRLDSTPRAPDVRLDAMVGMIDTVMDEMTAHKEKLSPSPQPGFRQPVMPIDVSQRPHTAPAGTYARPTSPDDFYLTHDSFTMPYAVTSYDTAPSTHPHVHSRRDATMKMTVIDAVDWRGKVTQDTLRPRPEAFIVMETLPEISSGPPSPKKADLSRPRSSLRTAGSTHGGRRPKTAPITPREKWGVDKVGEEDSEPRLVSQATSHTAKEVKPEVVSDLLQVQHLGGTSVRRRRRRFHQLDYDYFYEDDLRPHTVPSNGSGPSMEFMSITAPKSIAGGSRSTSPTKSVTFTTEPSDLWTGSALGGLVMPATSEGSDSADSMMGGDIDLPDMDDLHDDLSDDLNDLDLKDDLNDVNDDLQADDLLRNLNGDRPNEDHQNDKADEQLVPEEQQTHNGPEQLVLDAETTPQSSPERPQSSPADQAEVDPPQDHEEEDMNDVCSGHTAEDRPEEDEQVHEDAGQPDQDLDEADLNVVDDFCVDDDEDYENRSNYEVMGDYNGDNRQLLDDINKLLAGSSSGTRNTDKKRASSSSKGIIKTKQPLTRSEFWSYDPEPSNDEKLLKKAERLHARSASAAPPSPRHKTGRAFPVHREHSAPPQLQPQVNLSVEGVGRAQSAGHRTCPQDAQMSLRPRPQDAHMALRPRPQETHLHPSLQKHQEMLRRAPAKPLRTAPSIPTPHGTFGGRSPRLRTAYSVEHESHALKDQHPRRYLEKVVELRAPEVPEPEDPAEGSDPVALGSSLIVHKIGRAKARARYIKPAPSPFDLYPPGHPGTPIGSIDSDAIKQFENPEYQSLMYRIPQQPANQQPPSDVTKVTKQRYLETGRPIADYLEHVEPDDYAAAVEMQKHAKASVDIQKIFRGPYSSAEYSYLLRQTRELCENRRKAAIEIQRVYRGHLTRKRAIAHRAPDSELLSWARDYKETLADRRRDREAKAGTRATENHRHQAQADAKIAVIGSHLEVYDSFHPKNTGPNQELLHLASVVIQRHIRGWLQRQTVKKVKRKAKFQCGSWERFITYYRDFIFRLQCKLGIERPSFYFSYGIINSFLDTKRRFESVFEKKAFGGELDRDELGSVFRECDLYPSQGEVDQAYDLVIRGRPVKQAQGLQKAEVVELIFQIYPPAGTGLASQRRSTWMTPIIDREEALKLLGTEGVESTDFKTCWNIVAESQRRRNEAKQRQEQQRREDEWQRRHGVTNGNTGQGHHGTQEGTTARHHGDNSGTELNKPFTEQCSHSNHGNSDGTHEEDSPEMSKPNKAPIVEQLDGKDLSQEPLTQTS